MTIKYNKLVRDNIPQILEAQNISYSARKASPEEYRRKLFEKMQEEVKEFIKDPSAHELADILEVIYATAKLVGINKTVLERIRLAKKKERGGFEDRIILIETTE